MGKLPIVETVVSAVTTVAVAKLILNFIQPLTESFFKEVGSGGGKLVVSWMKAKFQRK